MVNPFDFGLTEEMQETVRRAQKDNLLRLHGELNERYSREDFNRICSGEGWLDMEGVILKAISTEFAPLGTTGIMLMFLVIPMIKALVTLAFVLGYEKAKAEALGRDLGLGEDNE